MLARWFIHNHALRDDIMHLLFMANNYSVYNSQL